MAAPPVFRMTKQWPSVIRFVPLPPTPYRVLHDYQNTIVSQYLASKKDPKVMIPQPTIFSTTIEPAVYTLGRREKISKLSEEELRHLENFPADVIEAERGGQTTFHGPGQAVLYPIIDLKEFGLTARDWVCTLEKATIKSLKKLGIRSAHTNEHTGVWVNSSDGVERKIASIGLHLRRNISSHGISVNVETQVLQGLQRITACGLVGREQTSIELEVGRCPPPSVVGRLLAAEIAFSLKTKIKDAMPPIIKSSS